MITVAGLSVIHRFSPEIPAGKVASIFEQDPGKTL